MTRSNRTSRIQALHGRIVLALTAALALAVPLARPAAAQQVGWIRGVVTDAAGAALAGAAVSAPERGVGAFTDEAGRFALGPLPAGAVEVRAVLLGYEDAIRSITIAAGDTARVTFDLAARPIALSGVEVSVLRPDLRPQAGLEARQVREANPRDVGELLRVLPGMSSVRRGPVGLDPVVRGLRETEVGVYLDGTRMFPAGPARMDSPLSHLDPSALENIEVVKGPYALTWGAGNMSAIRVETQDVPPQVPGPFHGRALSGYDSNLGAAEGATTAFGTLGRLSYWGHGVWREGNDFESGDGQIVQGDFLSREARGKVGYRLAPGSHLILSAGYQDQRDIDYPGRLLNADYFKTVNLAARWNVERPGGLLRSLNALAYVNNVDHGMDNDGKPTAYPNPDRMPPFAIDVVVDAAVRVSGGRLAATLAPGNGWTVEVGGDLYSANRDATRRISRKDNGMLMFEDLMWPDATITDAGLFTRFTRPLGERLSAAATVRLDRVRTTADTASDFFLAYLASDLGGTPQDLDASELNLSGAFTLSAALAANWSVAVGLGSVVRTADATERYSDRIPASKAQMSAEFMGNPLLAPERSTQADVWLEASYPRLSLQLNAFGRRVNDYVTLVATDLPKRLPLSPPIVYRYVNGDARFWGAEAALTYALTEPLTATVSGSTLWGEDDFVDEPALGIAPVQGDFKLRFEPPATRYYVEAALHAAGRQERVATSRGEVSTPGFVTADVQGGIELFSGTLLRVGVNNLADRAYVNHLNAKNPFTGLQLPEPGRVVFARLSYAF